MNPRQSGMSSDFSARDVSFCNRSANPLMLNDPRIGSFCRKILGRERPRRRAAEQRDELAAPEVEHGLLPGTRCASLPRLRMPWKRPQVLGVDLKSSESQPRYPSGK